MIPKNHSQYMMAFQQKRDRSPLIFFQTRPVDLGWRQDLRSFRTPRRCRMHRCVCLAAPRKRGPSVQAPDRRRSSHGDSAFWNGYRLRISSNRNLLCLGTDLPSILIGVFRSTRCIFQSRRLAMACQHLTMDQRNVIDRMPWVHWCIGARFWEIGLDRSGRKAL